MEICFVPDKDYGDFSRRRTSRRSIAARSWICTGSVLGHHDGIEFYTIGQRKGLGITTPRPLYVIELDAENNRVMVGDESALDRDEFTATLQLDSV